MWACGNNHIDVVRWLLLDGPFRGSKRGEHPEQGGGVWDLWFDVDAANKLGRNALMMAAKHG